MSWLRDSIAWRATALGCVALILVLGAIVAVLTVMTTDRARKQRVEWAHDRANGVAAAIDGIDLTSRTMVERVFPVLPSMVGKDFTLNEATGELSVGGRC